MQGFARITWLFLIWTSINSCRPLQQGSFLNNIYSVDDNNPSRRHEASPLEVNWTIHASGCSGTLLSPTLVLTAHHCALKPGSLAVSGWSVLSETGADMLVQQVLEDNPILDYAIVSVKWTRPMPSAQTFPPFLATTATDIFGSQVKDNGDTIFTVGFPDDKSKDWKATYSEGQIKYLENGKMYFNIGTINGNSGGGVLRKDNDMLVAIVIGGTAAYKDAGWNENSADDSRTWNFGTATWAIYDASAILKKQFPNGKNIYLKDAFFPKTKLYLSMETTDNGTNLKVATSHESEKVFLCPKDTYPCSEKTAGAEALTLDVAASGRRFYTRSQALTKAQVADLSFSAYDKAGNLVGMRHVTLEGAK